jgi:putative membrane protein
MKTQTTCRSALALILAGGAAAAFAQGAGNPAGQPPMTPERAPSQPAPLAVNDADRLFVQQAAIGSRAEVELGQMAQRKGTSDAVKAYAQRMAADHGDGNAKLAAVARNSRLPVPGALDADHRTMAEDLGRRRGADFDMVYARGQVIDHQRAVQLYEWVISAGQNESVKAYASQTLPLLLDHLEHAQRLVAELAAAHGTQAAAR